MISAFGIEHGEFSKGFRDKAKKKFNRAAYAVDDKLEGTKVSNAWRQHESRRGYSDAMSPYNPRYKPPHVPQGTWPRTEYTMAHIKGQEHQNHLRAKELRNR